MPRLASYLKKCLSPWS